MQHEFLLSARALKTEMLAPEETPVSKTWKDPAVLKLPPGIGESERGKKCVMEK